MKQIDQSELVTLRQASEMLGYSRTSMYRMMKMGLLRPAPGNPVKLKQSLYFYRRDIERLIQDRLRRKAS